MSSLKNYFIALVLVLFVSCVPVPESSPSESEYGMGSSAEKNPNQISEDIDIKNSEKLVIEGWVIGTHVEYLHTVVGFKTKDNRLLNLIFPGVHKQLSPDMYCRLTYYRINDTGYLPDFVRNQKANYFYLDNVELLDNNIRVK